VGDLDFARSVAALSTQSGRGNRLLGSNGGVNSNYYWLRRKRENVFGKTWLGWTPLWATTLITHKSFVTRSLESVLYKLFNIYPSPVVG